MEGNGPAVYRSAEDEVVELRRLVMESIKLVRKLHWKTTSSIEAHRCTDYLERARETLQVRV